MSTSGRPRPARTKLGAPGPGPLTPPGGAFGARTSSAKPAPPGPQATSALREVRSELAGLNRRLDRMSDDIASLRRLMSANEREAVLTVRVDELERELRASKPRED